MTEKKTVTQTAAKTLADNKDLFTTAAIFETGRIGNAKLGKLLGEKLPAPMNMLAQTPLGHLALANILKMVGDQVRPGDPMVERLTNGMVVAAYSELLQSFNLEEILDELLGDRGVAAALKKQQKAEG